jgi:lipopolysaccharide transport system permease protein
LPLIYLPLTIFCLAIGWAISALGVFVRDVAQIVPLLVQALMFTAPVFYPLEAVPPPLLRLVELNPLTSAVEGFRDTLSLSVQPNWSNFGLTTVAYFILAAACLWFFRRVQHAFADAI